ncbi:MULTISPECIES: DUF1415 domain-containing protein [Cupriavidus]|uniref:Peptidase n=1 Tax=Cupriavidus pinatubonensis (strain JMP 134 / LMG 1197) TaxID=264198 RepID=Q46YG4_CUPPJ|nr:MULTISPECIES: DUF1415 domain-containing protein [Cupriavidus]QYY30679.1 DUF1415 domain-containing protein [Cupriavidus pinatubonensis]TPQ39885.1 DUF1415 domain-containing protein [Cupriavidus pinatubonensis]
MPSSASHPDAVIAATRHWLARAVIGLNLCPFAKSVYVKEQVRYVVSTATEAPDVLDDLERELKLLAETDAARVDTTLLIVPDALADFIDYNDFLYFAERLLKSLRLEGTLQIASFHPQYQFDGTEPDDIENYTNRAPYPILHLLREDSIARAADAFPDAADIYERNMETVRRLGHEGWQRWMDGDDDAAAPRKTDE